jgi:hypothetical protein
MEQMVWLGDCPFCKTYCGSITTEVSGLDACQDRE